MENQFEVYQMRQTPETRQICFRSYQTLLEKGIRIRQKDYERVYMGTLYPQETPEEVKERLDRQLPRSFVGHSVSWCFTGQVRLFLTMWKKRDLR